MSEHNSVCLCTVREHLLSVHQAEPVLRPAKPGPVHFPDVWLSVGHCTDNLILPTEVSDG